MLKHPALRLRRVREKASVRDLVRETRISAANFIYPMFVTHGENVRQEIEPMPGCYHTSIDRLSEEIDESSGTGNTVGVAVRFAAGQGRGGQWGL